VAPGRLPASLLVELSAHKNVAAALKSLESAPVSAPGGSSYGTLLAEVLPAYQRGNHLSELEAALRRYQAGWQVAQIGRDPLGEGVLLGFLALKAQEAANLRRIASGTWRGAAPRTIRSRLGNAV
jgi:vacuolar-type H+-ATPase subunit C/Vma6